MLPSGVVLTFGNGTAQLYDERVPARADAPQFNPLGPVLAPSPTEVDGARFITGVGGDDGTTLASPGDMPIVLFRHLASGLVRIPVTEGHDDHSVVLGIAGDFQPGWYAGIVTVSGVQSNPQTFFLTPTCAIDADCHGSYCATQDMVCCPTQCNGSCVSGVCNPIDAGIVDSGTPDSGTPDSGTPDAGSPDSGTPDAGAPDAGTPDGGSGADAGFDGGEQDAGTSDSGAPDGGFGPKISRTVGCGCNGTGLSPFALLALLAWRGRKSRR
jgi:uncharacterized protein (TIGR03382 family)